MTSKDNILSKVQKAPKIPGVNHWLMKRFEKFQCKKHGASGYIVPGCPECIDSLNKFNISEMARRDKIRQAKERSGK